MKIEVDGVYRFRTLGHLDPWADIIVTRIASNETVYGIWKLSKERAWHAEDRLARERFAPHPDPDGEWARYVAWRLTDA